MSHPAAATALPPEPARTDVLLRQAITRLEECRAATERAIAERGPLGELMACLARLADLQSDLRHVAMQQSLAEVEAATQPVPEAAPRKARHRARHGAEQGAMWPRAVRDIGPAGVVVAAFRPLSTALRHSWAAHPVATAATGVAAVTLATGAAIVPHAGVTLPFGAGTSATPNPAASVYSATPVAGPSSLPPFASAVTHPKADPDAATSRPLTLAPPPAVSPVQGPGDQQGGNRPSAPAQVTVAGTLQVTGGTTDLSLGADGLTYSGSVTFTAEGGSVRWGTVSNSPHVAVSTDQGALQGVLQPGDSVTLTVSVDAAAQLLGGTATVHVYPGIAIGVTWLALPPLPDPAGSILPTVLPSVLPSL